MSSQNADDRIYTVKAMYLGSEPMGELLEGENGSDVIQVPLKRTILRTNGIGKEVELSITSDSLVIRFSNKADKSGTSSSFKLPIELLAYCGALRQLPQDKVKTREFETLDKSPMFDDLNSDQKLPAPPLFVTIFRSLDNENTLFCHSFVIRQDEEAMELVKLVMEIYYNLIKLNDSGEDAQEVEEETAKNNGVNLSIESLDTAKRNEIKEILEMYNKLPQNENSKDEKSIVSAKDLLKQQAIESKDYKVEIDKESLEKYGDVPLNQDDDPIIIKKENNEQVVYKQNVFIRWLQPPTPPPPAPIIIREVQEPVPEPLPPIVIYKQAPRPPTPPPLIIRERPPSPLEIPKKPIIIERRVPVPEKHRKVIIEHLPAPPPKPRDIILEKWIPREPAPRAIYVQKTQNQLACQQRPVYEVIDHHRPRKDLYEPMYPLKSKHGSRRSNSNELIYHSNPLNSNRIYSPVNLTNNPVFDYYSGPGQLKKPIVHHHNHPQHQQKIAGYRIIRQIIPGANSSPGDIEKALARSRQVSCTLYSNHRFYSPTFENYPTTSSARPIYSNNSTNNNNNFYSMHPFTPHPKSRQIIVQQTYTPHNHIYQGDQPQQHFLKKTIYRSSSIDNF